VTHRDASSSFAVITGHERSETGPASSRAAGAAEERRRWDKIAFAADTLIFLMGVENLPEIASKLIENGRAESTPVALVRWGTWAGKQETLIGELGTIAEKVKQAGFKAPAVTIIGDVVNWRSRLQWWDNRPLFGKTIVVTRAREQASGLVDSLINEGAEPIEFPTIRISEPRDNYSSLDAAIASLSTFEWIVFTSVNAVNAVIKRLKISGRDARAFAGLKIAAVGPATAQALAAYGLSADFLPTKFVGHEVATEFPGDQTGQRILIPRAKEGNDELPEKLTERGAIVTLATAYETEIDTAMAPLVLEKLQVGEVDVVTFTSSSTVKNFHLALGPDIAAMNKVLIACIGPSTAQTARELFSREPDIIAQQQHTVPGLVEALKEYFRSA